MSVASVSLQDVQQKVQQRVLKTRVRLSEAFQDYDRHKVKKVTVAQALRAINTSCAISLTPDEVNVLVATYGTPDGLSFRYQDFCDDIDSVFTTKGLEKKPDAVPTATVALAPAVDLGEEDEATVSALLASLGDLVQTRGIVVKSFFRDYDRSNSGAVTRAQFEREIKRCFPALADSDVAILALKYAANGGKDVRYRDLHAAVTPAAGAVASVSGRLTKLKLTSGPVDVDALEDALIREVSANRIRVRDFFSCFDRMRTGHCTADQFRRGLFLCKFSCLSDEGMQALSDKYFNAAKGFVRYDDFVTLLEEAFTKKGLEKAPTATLDSRSKAIATAPLRSVFSLSPEEDAAAE